MEYSREPRPKDYACQHWIKIDKYFDKMDVKRSNNSRKRSISQDDIVVVVREGEDLCVVSAELLTSNT